MIERELCGLAAHKARVDDDLIRCAGDTSKDMVYLPLGEVVVLALLIHDCFLPRMSKVANTGHHVHR